MSRGTKKQRRREFLHASEYWLLLVCLYFCSLVFTIVLREKNYFTVLRK